MSVFQRSWSRTRRGGLPSADGDRGHPRYNRLLLKQLMADAGFTNYVNEWWHFSLAGEPYPKTYFDFPVARGALAGG